MAEGKVEAEVTYNQTIAEERAKGEVIRMITLFNLCVDVYSFQSMTNIKELSRKICQVILQQMVEEGRAEAEKVFEEMLARGREEGERQYQVNSSIRKLAKNNKHF